MLSNVMRGPPPRFTLGNGGGSRHVFLAIFPGHFRRCGFSFSLFLVANPPHSPPPAVTECKLTAKGQKQRL